MRTVARYPELRDDGSMWVPLAPPPAPTYRQLSRDDVGVVGMSAVLSYSTEWVVDLRLLTEPYEEHTSKTRSVVRLCTEGAWHDYERHDLVPQSHEQIVASVRLVFLVLNAQEG